MLFPSAHAPRPTRRYTELAQATSSTTPNLSDASASPASFQSLQLYPRGDSTHISHSVASPFQNPRVRNSIHSTSASGVTGNGTRPRFYPTGQYSLQQQQQQNNNLNASPTLSPSAAFGSSSRPPVPLFTSHSTGEISLDTAMADSSSNSTLFANQHEDREAKSCADQFEEVCHDSLLDGFQADTFGFSHTVMPTEATFQPVSNEYVSPKDLFGAADMSAPPSSAFTNLSTPTSFEHSPFGFIASADTSPLYALDDNFDGEQDMYSLFPTESSSSLELQKTIEPAEPFVNAAVAQPMSRNASSPGQQSIRTSHQRHSSVSGVNARKRDKPLPPVTVADPNDPVSVKRSRNTMAARKSRAKKQNRMETLETTVDELTAELNRYKDRFGPLPQ